MEHFDSKTYGEIHEQPWFKIKIAKFGKDLKSYNQYYCSQCKESWPTKFNRCDTCLNKYVKSNKMDPSHERIPLDIKKRGYNIGTITNCTDCSCNVN